MASTLVKIEKLAREEAERLSNDPRAWMDFLTGASRIYLYPFQDQLLIHAQRPDATACASMEIWNRKMNCRIRRGAVGIALIHENSGHRKLRYVFDVSDTYPIEGIGRSPVIWELASGRTAEVGSYLAEAFSVSLQTAVHCGRGSGSAHRLSQHCLSCQTDGRILRSLLYSAESLRTEAWNSLRTQ